VVSALRRQALGPSRRAEDAEITLMASSMLVSAVFGGHPRGPLCDRTTATPRPAARARHDVSRGQSANR